MPARSAFMLSVRRNLARIASDLSAQSRNLRLLVADDADGPELLRLAVAVDRAALEVERELVKPRGDEAPEPEPHGARRMAS